MSPVTKHAKLMGLETVLCKLFDKYVSNYQTIYLTSSRDELI